MAKQEKNIPEDPVAEWVVQRFNESKNYYKPLYDKFEDWDKQYFSIPDDKKYSWQSNIFVPATFKAIKTLLARITAALFSTNPPFDVLGVEAKDKPGEVPIKLLINYQFEKTKIFDKFTLLVLQALIRGTSVGKVYWKKEYTYVPRVVDYDEEEFVTVDEEGKPLKKGKKRSIITKKQKTIYEKKVLYEGPDFEVIDILGGWFTDPYGTNDGYNIHRVVRTADYLRMKYNSYDNIEKALATEYPGDTEWSHSRLESIGLIEPENINLSTNEEESKTDEGLAKYELLEYHGKYDINDDGKLEDAIITVCNRSVVIKKVLSPYPEGCFVKIVFMPVLNEVFGQGVCELTEPLQTELNDKRNQRIDNVNLCLQKILAYVEGQVDTRIIKNFVFAPGARLPVKDINAMAWVEVPDVTASSYNEEKILTGDIQETSGAANVLQNAPASDIHRTASGLFMLKGEAETTIKLTVQLMESQGLSEIAKKYDLLNKNFMTKPLMVRILGAGGSLYPILVPDDIKYYNCDFIFKGASAYVNRELRLAQLTQLMDVISKMPMLQNQVDPQKVIKMIANTLGFDEAEFLRQPNQQLQQLGMQAQGMPGRNMPQVQTPSVGSPPIQNLNEMMQQMQQQGGGIGT